MSVRLDGEETRMCQHENSLHGAPFGHLVVHCDGYGNPVRDSLTI